jgi:pyruvate-formate lyase
MALAASLSEMAITIDPEELIVGNRTHGIRSGVVFPEAGLNWLMTEIETLPYRFLFVILHMESNASSFSPGRMDQYLYPYFKNDIESKRIDYDETIELLDALFIKFNQIAYTLADGGMSPMYGRDKTGPTAVLNSVSRIPSHLASNGTLLNMKFLPSLFSNPADREKFTSFLKTFICLPINHVQFNVVTPMELINAKNDPESY